jgi:transglutaminase-like putative cysteine protease
MTTTSRRGSPAPVQPGGTSGTKVSESPRPQTPGPGPYPWLMAGSIVVAVLGAALSLNGVLRGWAWFMPLMTTVLVVALTLALLRALRAQPLLATLGSFASLAAILSFTFFRQESLAGFIPTAGTFSGVGRLIKRAAETVVSESAPVAPNAGIVFVMCACLGLLVILIDALAVPLSMPAASGIGLLAVMVVPATIKPQSVGAAGFIGAVVGYLLILGCSHWFAPDARLQSGSGRGSGQFRRSLVTGGLALALTMVVPLAIPGFETGTFPQGSRLSPWGTSNGLNPMITLGNSLRSPTGSGRITYATSANGPLYLRSVTIDHFDGETWAPDERAAQRRAGADRIETGYSVQGDVVNTVTSVNAGLFTSPYLPAPFAPASVNGLNGRWTWDPATLSIMSTETTTRAQRYVVFSGAPRITAESLSRATAAPQGISEDFLRIPGNLPEIVRQTADSVTASESSNYGKALAIQKYLRSGEFTYSLQAPVQNGYDGNGLSVLADFLAVKSGYCVHFSSAMAVMARAEGIPSRIAVGYAPGRLTGESVALVGQGSFPEYEVDARDAHAWPELYFEGLGWVPFEPTPSRGVPPDYATESSVPGNLSTNADEKEVLTTPAPATPAPVPLPGVETPETGSTSVNPLPAIGAAAAGVALLFAFLWSPRLSRSILRRRRLNQKPPDEADALQPGYKDPVPELAWAELQDLATDYGLPSTPSETPRHFSTRLRSSTALGDSSGMDNAAHAAVASLTSDFERQRYGRQGGPASPSAAATRIAVVRDSLRNNARWLVRFRADWLPPSMMRRWVNALGAPFRAVGSLATTVGRGLARRWRTLRGALPQRR